jgi:hypothetical protein
MINITGLWLNKSDKGETYMAGNVGYGARVLIFKNKSKRGDKDPDYNLVIAERKRDSDGGGAPPADDAPPF